MSETQLKQKVKEYLKHIGVFGVKIAGGLRQRAGISDLLIVLPPRGRLLAMELKAPGKLKEVTPLQRDFLEQIAKAGGYAVVCDELEAAKDIISRALASEA